MAFKKKIIPIQKILVNSFGNSTCKYGFLISLLQKDWSDIVGQPLCNFTKPIFIKENIIYVSCLHNGIIQNLNFQTNQIMEIINQFDYGYKFEGVKFIPNKFNKNN